MNPPTPLTFGALKQILSDAGCTDATVLMVDQGWLSSVDRDMENPWITLYQASPNIEGPDPNAKPPKPLYEFVVLS
jgi:hypothetical protein